MTSPTVPTALSRRHFLQRSACLLGAAAAVPSALGGDGFQSERVRPAGRPKLSLAAYSFRDRFGWFKGAKREPSGPGEPLDMIDFIDYCAAQDCPGAELTSYFLSEPVTDASLIALRRHAFLRGVTISGTAIGNNFSLTPGDRRDAEIAAAKHWIDRAAVLGAPHVRVFAGQNPALAEDEANRLVIAALEECADHAGERGVFLGIENHDSIGSAERLLAIVRAVRSPWLGVNLDTANFRTEDPYADIAACVPFAVNVQIKTDIGRGSSAGERPADLARLIGMLRAEGYAGWVALEYESSGDPTEAVPRYLAELRTLLA